MTSRFFLKLGSSLPVLECNPMCKCVPFKCSNRVVQLGPAKGLRIAGMQKVAQTWKLPIILSPID